MVTGTSDKFTERREPGARVRVLLVGESAAVVTGGSCLSAAGYDARLERDGGAALAALEEAPFDLIIIDWHLPTEDGVGLCRAIRARPRYADLHVIVLTPAHDHLPARALKAGADDYLVTPFEDVQLLARARAGVRSAQLHASEAQLRALIANVPGAIYRCANDQDWTMELISDEIERISGYPPTDFIDRARRTFASVIHPDDRDQVQCAVAEATQQGHIFALEYRIIRADGGVAWVLERGQQVHGGNDRNWLDGVILDISDWRRAEDHLRQSLHRLAIADDRERIARELHDGVIQSLFGVGMTLQAATMNADQPEVVRACLAASVDQIDLVIEDIRNYVFKLRPRLLADRQLHEVLNQLAQDFQDESQVVTVVDVDAALAAQLAPRAEDILQLAREALSNVRRHAQATTCRVSLKRTDGAALLEIDDDGRGFEPAAANNGQGLRNLTERSEYLGGQFKIDSGSAGTTVTFQLPF